MRVAVLGAGSDVGRVICHALVQSKMLPSNSELVLIGRREGRSRFIVRGMAEDFSEAFMDQGIRFLASLDPADAWGDFLIFVASVPDPAHFTRIFHRERLAEDNCRLAQQLLPIIQSNRDRIGWTLVVTNPNELMVHLLSQVLNPQRVIAIGALVDSFRFRLELARELHVPPPQVTAWAGGEHGPNMLFFWSLVQVEGKPLEPFTLRQLRCPSRELLEQERAKAFQTVEQVLAQEGLDAAYAALRPFSPEVRAMVKSYLTHTSGAKTGGVAAQAVLTLMRAIRSKTPTFLCAQVVSEVGTVGVPLLLSRDGFQVQLEVLSEEERQALRQIGALVQQSVEQLVKSNTVGTE